LFWNTVNATVRPTEVPIWRNSVRSLVAVPSSLNGTAFCTISVKTAIIGPPDAGHDHPEPEVQGRCLGAQVREQGQADGDQRHGPHEQPL